MSDLSNQSLWLISTSVFIGGVIGSPHCLSMCGPLVFNFSNKRSYLFSYQLGRMLAYSIAGAVLGSVGSSLLGQSRPQWISNLTLITISILLIFNGYRAIAGKPLHFSLPPFLNHWIKKVWSLIRTPSLPKGIVALMAGFLTVLLPCGHLYGFLLGAAVTGSALKGAVFMFAFWLGSTPLLSASGGVLQTLIGSRMGRSGQRLAGVLLVVSGLLSLIIFSHNAEGFSKSTLTSQKSDVKSINPPSEGTHHCH